jgi:sorbitol-6-phosphate 2-dehydrogenase
MKPTWLDLQGKNVIITGGGSGIGLACGRAFAEAGASVAVIDRDLAAAQRAVKKYTDSFNGTHLALQVDVSSREQVCHMITHTIATLGAIDVLINNAGINIPRLLVDPSGKEELTEAIWDQMVNINQKGVFLCSQETARHMIQSQRQGAIINITSESGQEGSEGQSAYAGTKGALYALTRSWAKELGQHGIRVVGVAPGIIEATGLRSEEYERALAYSRGINIEQLRQGYEKVSIPMGRAGKLTEIADAVCYLASSRASYITGTVLNLSGGKSRG